MAINSTQVVGGPQITSANELATQMMNLAQMNFQKKTQKDMNFLKFIDMSTGGDPDALIDLAAEQPEFLSKGFASALGMKLDQATKLVSEIPTWEKTMRGQLNDAIRLITQSGAGGKQTQVNTVKKETGTGLDNFSYTPVFDESGASVAPPVVSKGGEGAGRFNVAGKNLGGEGSARAKIMTGSSAVASSRPIRTKEQADALYPKPVEQQGPGHFETPLSPEDMKNLKELRIANQTSGGKIGVAAKVISDTGSLQNPVLSANNLPTAETWTKLGGGQISAKEGLSLAQMKLDPSKPRDRATANAIIGRIRAQEAFATKTYESVKEYSTVNMSPAENKRRLTALTNDIKKSGYMSKSIQMKLNQEGYQEKMVENISNMIQNFGGNAELMYRAVFPEANAVANTELQRQLAKDASDLEWKKIQIESQKAGLSEDKYYTLLLKGNEQFNASQKIFQEYVNGHEDYKGDMKKAYNAIKANKDPLGQNYLRNLEDLIKITGDIKNMNIETTKFLIGEKGWFSSPTDIEQAVIPAQTFSNQGNGIQQTQISSQGADLMNRYGFQGR